MPEEKVFAEVGLGNDTFLSTEIEKDGTEQRLPGFKKPKIITGYYLRFWVFKRVLIVSTDAGFKILKKDRNKLKLLFGISGTSGAERIL